MITNRFAALKQLAQISCEVKDLKKFEREGPKIMHTLRELTIRIVKAICKFTQWRNSNYVKHIL